MQTNIFTLLHFISFLIAGAASHSLTSNTRARRIVQKSLIVGYANWNQCDQKIVEFVHNGGNVIVWFSIFLSINPVIQGGPNLTCVAEIAKQIKKEGYEVLHLISIGGWNTRHPDTSITPQEAYNSWNQWNLNVVANKNFDFAGFDGFDWDLEGNDDPNSIWNAFTVDCLDLIGQMSSLAKKDGYITTLAPAESYFDPSTNAFDRSLKHTYKEWEPTLNFAYHGRNCYAYVYSKYEMTTLEDGGVVPTFDWVFLQLYEGYSHILYNTTKLQQPAADYIVAVTKALQDGWIVNFSSDLTLAYPDAHVSLPSSSLLIGLANGWADNSKFLRLDDGQLKAAANALKENEMHVKGWGFWDIADEGRMVEGAEFWLTSTLRDLSSYSSRRTLRLEGERVDLR
jgi:Glycosyl hydrolases family 18